VRSEGAPVLVVVGRPGQGTTSVVSALAEVDAGIGDSPFTTVASRDWPLPPEGTSLLTIRDLPGLQDAARALAALGPPPAGDADRLVKVAALLAAHRGEDLREERELLRALLDGASYLHVVDGSRPYRPNHRADAELLAWLGRPGLLLVNPAGGAEDHVREWIEALGKVHAGAVRLDAAVAGPAERRGVLAALAEVRTEWAAALEGAAAALLRRRRALRGQAAAAIARLLSDQLSHAEELTVEKGEPLEPRRAELEERFHRRLSEREAEARREVEALYGFAPGAFEGDSLAPPVYARDLFAEDTWSLAGLSPRQQLLAGAAAGAVVGLAGDAALGGASLGAGAALGGVAGAGTAVWNLSRRRIRAHTAGPLGGARRALDALLADGSRTRLVIGPHTGPSFPWVLLARAELHHQAVAARSHGRRGPARLPAEAQPGAAPPARDDATVGELEPVFRRIRRHHEDAGQAVAELVPPVERLLGRGAPLPDDGAPAEPPRLPGGQA
jgi:hypothetical protein